MYSLTSPLIAGTGSRLRLSLRSALRAATIVLGSSLALAQSPLTTTYIQNPGSGGLGNSAVYFDLTVNVPLVVHQLDVNAYAGAGSGAIEFWTAATSWVGNTAIPAAWTWRGSSATVTAAPLGTPTVAPFSVPFALAPGTYGVAIVYRGTLGPAYSAGNGANQVYSNTELTLQAGAAGNIFGGGFSTPRVWNGSIHYQRSNYGTGCVFCPASLYERFVTPAAFDMSATTIGHRADGTLVHGGGTFVPPSAAAVNLNLSDDAETTITLGNPFPLHCGGLATTLTVCSNGFVSLASNGVGHNPSVSGMLGAPNTAWWFWHDFNPGAGGAIKHEVYFTDDIITWEGVFDYGSTTPSTWQLVFRSSGDVEWRFLSVSPVGGTGIVFGYSPGGPNADFGNTDMNLALPISLCCTEVVPLALRASARALVGTNVSLVTTNVPVGAPFGAVLYGFARFDPGVPIAPLPGCFQHNDWVTGDVTVGPLQASFTTLATFLNPVPSFVGLSIQAQAAVYTGGAPAALTSNGVSLSLEGMVIPPGMVPIAAGTFSMGSMQGELDEQPVHQATITHPFWMAKYEVRQSDYQFLMGSNPSANPGPLLPVEMVSWYQAMAYCAALTVQEAAAGRVPAGYQYRLPTEAEWEYCCRAGTTTEWNVGSSLSCAQANVANCVAHTTAVGSYAANAWGLHDMHGNVTEWCLDGVPGGAGAANYPAGAVVDPYVISSTQPLRVRRDGPFFFAASGSRSAGRTGGLPGWSGGFQGFRVVLAPVLVP